MTPAALELRGVSKAFGVAPDRRVVLGGVDLEVAAGEVVALFGRSGSGKTTLLTVASGFDAADAGEVRIGGEPVTATASWSTAALLPQSLGLLDELTVIENVALPLLLASMGDARAVDAVLDRLSLAHLGQRLPSEISLGEQQRTALARAVVVRPAVLIADEPVSHQNRALAETMIDEIAALAAAGTACLLATHDDTVVRIADRVVELRDGTLSAPIR